MTTAKVTFHFSAPLEDGLIETDLTLVGFGGGAIVGIMPENDDNNDNGTITIEPGAVLHRQ